MNDEQEIEERHLAEGFADLQAGQSITFVGTDDATDIFFGSAFSALLRLAKSEDLDSKFRGSREREDILTACIMSFLSLESAINLLFHETFKSGLRKLKSGIPDRLVQHIKRNWNDKGVSVRDKYLLLPPLICDFEFDPGALPFQLFDEFISFRNGLVHAKPKTQKTTIKITDIIVDESPQSGAQLSGEFVNHTVDSVPSAQRFPQTHLATSFTALSKSDAEKALEITYRMRMALHNATKCSPPSLFVDVDSGPFLTTTTIGTELGRLFTPHFGPLP